MIYDKNKKIFMQEDGCEIWGAGLANGWEIWVSAHPKGV